MRAEGRHFEPLLDEITKKIIDMMIDGTWKTGKSHRQLLQEYPDRSPTQIRQCSSAAARFMRICRGEEDEIRERILQELDRGIELALEAETVHYDQVAGEFRTTKQPNLAAHEKYIARQADIHGLLTRDPKRPQTEKVDVPLDELTRVLDLLGYDVIKRKDETNGSSDGSGTSAEESED